MTEPVSSPKETQTKLNLLRGTDLCCCFCSELDFCRDGITYNRVFCWTYHAAAGVTRVLQVVVQQFGGSILEGLGQSSQQHGELWGVELKQGDQHHLGGLEAVQHNRLGCWTQSGKFRCFPWYQKCLDRVFQTAVSPEIAGETKEPNWHFLNS